MITYVAGNLFTSPAKVLVNTVNTQGVMGKGIALQFKKIYPDMFKKYQQFCESGEIDIGVLWIYKTPHKWILNFPTKKHWRNSSKIEYIESGLEKFSEKFIDLAIHSIAFPALGCGNGELDWEETVKPVMESYLNRIPIDIFVHPPIPVKELPEHKKKAEIEKWLRSEPRSLAFSEVWEDVSEVLSNKSRFRTTTGNEFEAKTQIDKESDSDSKFLVIKTKNRNYRIDYHQLSDLWQQFRQHGYLRRGIVPNWLERNLSYLMPIFTELDYVQTIKLLEPGKFSNKGSGIQYMAPPALKQQNLFN